MYNNLMNTRVLPTKYCNRKNDVYNQLSEERGKHCLIQDGDL